MRIKSISESRFGNFGRRSPVRVKHICNQCELPTIVSVNPVIPQTYNSPAEGGEFEPDLCDHCGHEIDQMEVYELASQEIMGREEEAAEAKAQSRLDY